MPAIHGDFNLGFLSALALVFLGLLYARWNELGIEKTLAINSLRAMAQLLLLGFVLVYVLRLTSPPLLLGILLAMTCFAAHTAQKRVGLLGKGRTIALMSIASAAFSVLFTLIALRAIRVTPNEMIPIGGMIIGQSLNVYTLLVDRLKGEIRNTVDIIENKVALGATVRQALQEPMRQAAKAAFIPIINNLQTVGIIFIPGMMTGMLVAGSDPLLAVSYQLIIMYMMVGVSVFTIIYAGLFVSGVIIPTSLKREARPAGRHRT